jgi:hypothetical protein
MSTRACIHLCFSRGFHVCNPHHGARGFWRDFRRSLCWDEAGLLRVLSSDNPGRLPARERQPHVYGRRKQRHGLLFGPRNDPRVTPKPFSRRRTEEYGLSNRQATDASDRAVDSRVVLVRTNDRLQHFWRRSC